MIAPDTQNTITGGGGAIIAPTGNGILDGIISLSNTYFSGANAWEDLEDRKTAREIAAANAVTTPVIASSSNLNSLLNTNTSDTAKTVQNLFFYGVGFILVGSFALYAIKKI